MKYDLVFEGGGAKGMVFVGAMQVFEEEKHTFDRLLGTSAGAITATLLAAGYSSKEMLAALAEQAQGKSVFTTFMATPKKVESSAFLNSDLNKFFLDLDIPYVPGFVETKLDKFVFDSLAKSKLGPNLYSLFELGGWFTADYFLDWLKRKLNEGTYKGKQRNFSEMSLKQFYNATGTDLSLVASNTSAHQLLVLNHRTAPRCPVAWAVRMSMSIPLVWPDVIWKKEWGKYQGEDISGDAIVDGGLLSNFPIELFLSADKEVLAVMGPHKPDAQVLGMLIDETKPVTISDETTMPEADKLSPTDVRLVQRLLNLIDTVTQAHDKMVMDANQNLVVRLPAKGYGTTEFDMSEQKRKTLVAAGKRTMQEFFTVQKQQKGGAPTVSRVKAEKSMDRIATNLVSFKKGYL